MKKLPDYIRSIFLRNEKSLAASRARKNRVNLEWWSQKKNVGDAIAPVIYQWMMARQGLDPDKQVGKTIHLLTVGSILAMKPFNAVVWGSGILSLSTLHWLLFGRKMVRYDVRALRGPLTRDIMTFAGYSCGKAALGDPAILMPLLYQPEETEKKYPVSLILHLKRDGIDGVDPSQFHLISPQTDDYRQFIDEIKASELVVSSSLHGIILAEAYGVPAVFLNREGRMNVELLKFYDWYFSTGRMTVLMATSLEEALQVQPMDLPDLTEMQQGLLKSFPYDLWTTK